MHDAEFNTSLDTVRRLLRAQAPDWTGAEISQVSAGGTDNRIYRLDQTACIRLPRTPVSSVQLAAEWHTLHHLNPLELASPKLIFRGRTDAEFQGNWAIYSWIAGDVLNQVNDLDSAAAAKSLAGFVQGLRRKAKGPGKLAGRANHDRGAGLHLRDTPFRSALARISDLFDTAELSDIWADACAAARWKGTPVWIHGDLHGGNLIARDGQLCGVIDFGLAGLGDPAVDLLPAWWVLGGDARADFLDAAADDDAMVRRGRGWALSISVIALAYYRIRNPGFASDCDMAIRSVRQHYNGATA